MAQSLKLLYTYDYFLYLWQNTIFDVKYVSFPYVKKIGSSATFRIIYSGIARIPGQLEYKIVEITKICGSTKKLISEPLIK